MSIEAVKALLEKAGGDERLQGALDAALREEKPVESFLKVARENGCDFSADEFLEVMGTSPDNATGEMSDAQLEAVSGGVSLSSSWSGLATNVFRTFRSSPSANTLGLGGGFANEQEEEVLA